jgi:hypothetical protein
MANFCPNCGQNVSTSDRFCAACGAQLTGDTTAAKTYTDTSVNTTATTTNTTSDILGTLVTVSLIGGLTRQLYYYGGRYFLDPYCHNPFMSPHLICGRHMPPPMRPMGGPHGGPMGGGPRGGGPMGGPRGGGPRGGGHR